MSCELLKNTSILCWQLNFTSPNAPSCWLSQEKLVQSSVLQHPDHMLNGWLTSRFSPQPTTRDQLQIEVALHLIQIVVWTSVVQHPSWVLTLLSKRDLFHLQVNFKIGPSPYKTPHPIHPHSTHPHLPHPQPLFIIQCSLNNKILFLLMINFVN